MANNPYSGKAVIGYIVAAIFGAFFIASLAQGYLVQRFGDIRSAIGFYFIALLLLGVTKLVLWEVRQPVKKKR
jgi:fucose permease